MNWSQPSTYAATGVHHGYATAPYDGDDPRVADAVKVWWGRLDPGGFIVPHIDASPWHVRWHYPVAPSGFVWQNGATSAAPPAPFLITHWEPHAVWVLPDQPARVHLIAEYAERVPGRSGLTLHLDRAPAALQALMAAVG